MVGELIRAAGSKTPAIRKHAWKYVDIVLRRMLGGLNSHDSAKPPNEILVLIDQGLRVGINDSAVPVLCFCIFFFSFFFCVFCFVFFFVLCVAVPHI